MATTDILKFFPENSIGEHFGLFEDFYKKEKKIIRLKSSLYGVSKTNFYFAKEIIVGIDNDRHKLTVLDIFHGYCCLFLSYFIKMNKDWKLGVLLYDNDSNWVNHAFAYLKTKDDRILFADARGYTDDILLFFDDFSYSKRNMKLITENHNEYESWKNRLESDFKNYENTDLNNSIKNAYDIIFKEQFFAAN